MKILITGARGMLGRTLCDILNSHEIIPTDKYSMDITDTKSVSEVVAKYRPDVVIHSAAMTAVDLCETEVDKAYRVNAIGTGNVASACDAYGCRLIAISTDYVFDGKACSAYNEYDVPTGGPTVYGKSKWAGEQLIRVHCPNHVIARVAWLYGVGGPSFVHTMLNLSAMQKPMLKVVNDQRGNPTSTLEVARALAEIIDHPEIRGTFHLTCEGATTWYEFAKTIFEIQGIPQKIRPCSSEEYPRPAPRPQNSCLENMNLRLYGLKPMKGWKEALIEFLKYYEFKN